MKHLLLWAWLHLQARPLFMPSPSGVHDARLTVSNSLQWNKAVRHESLHQPVGVLIRYSGKFS